MPWRVYDRLVSKLSEHRVAAAVIAFTGAPVIGLGLLRASEGQLLEGTAEVAAGLGAIAVGLTAQY